MVISTSHGGSRNNINDREVLRSTRTKSSGAAASAHSPPGWLVALPALRAASPVESHVVYLERSWRVSLRNLSETASMYTPSFQQRCRQSHSVTLDCNANPKEPSAALEEPTCIGLGVGAERAVSKDCAISWNRSVK